MPTLGNSLLDHMDMAMVDMEFRWLLVVCKTLGLFLDQAMDMDWLRHLAMSEAQILMSGITGHWA